MIPTSARIGGGEEAHRGGRHGAEERTFIPVEVRPAVSAFSNM
jgi:hypothetical protein